MKQVLVALFAVFIGVGIALQDADAARRFGGGTSSGMQRSAPIKRDAAPTQNTAPKQPTQTTPQQSGAGRWLGPLAGLAAGIGLAALFSHLGLGEELASFAMILLIGAAIFFVFRFLMRRLQPQAQQMQYAGVPGGAVAYDAATMGRSDAPNLPSAQPTIDTPDDFDAQGFLRQAKLNFIRLQAANDAGNIEDIRAFTTPEMFAEIKLQLQERGEASQKCDVVTLDAELIEFASEFRERIASVRFIGAIRESTGATPEAFDEVWHFTKPVDGNRNWVIAGIQQTA